MRCAPRSANPDPDPSPNPDPDPDPNPNPHPDQVRTSLGFSLDALIWPGIRQPATPVGCLLGDAECYDRFGSLLDRVVEEARYLVITPKAYRAARRCGCNP